MFREMSLVDNRKKYLLAGLGALGVLGFFAAGFSNLLSADNDILNFVVLVTVFSALTLLAFPPNFTKLTNWWGYVILMQFALAPVLCEVLDVSHIDAFAVRALVFILLGTFAFWAGARLRSRNAQPSMFSYSESKEENHRIHVAIVMLVLGCLAKLYMLRAGLFMYGSDVNQVEAASQYREYLTIFGSFTVYAQIILTIEFISGKRTLLVKYAFWGATAANLVFSLVSGMKGELFVIPLCFFLIQKLSTGRIEWRMIGGMALLGLLVFPLNYSYRSEVNSQGSVTSLGVGKNALGRAIDSLGESNAGDYVASSIEGVANRLNLLPNVVFLDEERTRGNSIEGDERIWMIPFYPFVPRFLWKDKPILDKGRRLSVAAGSTESSSMAVTPFGDLLITGGAAAVMLGMFGVGIVLQTVTNIVNGEFGPKSLFVYCVLFSKFYSAENDIVLLGTSLIQATCVALFVAYFVYGGKLFRCKSATVR